jgi:hypothetical protein
MYGEPELWSQLLDRLATITLAFLRVQIDAGASAVQLFDSWVGALPAADYRAHVQPHSARVLAAVSDVPRIHFGVGTGELLHDMGQAGADVVGVDWRVPLSDAVQRIGPGKAVQGNLDPTLVFAPLDVVERKVREVSRRARRPRGTSSTSATACCRRPTPTCCYASSSWSTRAVAPVRRPPRSTASTTAAPTSARRTTRRTTPRPRSAGTEQRGEGHLARRRGRPPRPASPPRRSASTSTPGAAPAGTPSSSKAGR